MRILLLTQIVPYPPDSGPKVKTHNVLRYLARRHEVHVVSFTRGPEEDANARALRSSCGSVTTVPLRRSRLRDALYLVRSLCSGRPFLVERDDVSAMRETVHRVAREQAVDAVHADQLTMGQFAIDLPVSLRLLDEHNAVWTIVRRAARRERGPRRLLAELEWRKLRRYEGDLCERFDRVTVVSDDDRLALEQAARGPFGSATIPIAMDTEALAYVPPREGARDVLSVATMYYPPNAEAVDWFASAVFPLVHEALPATRFHIVGSRPPAFIRRLATDDSGILVPGYVADLVPLMRRCAVLVVPVLSGSGMRVKILEAFARGIPVVSTSVGVEGIDARDGQHLLVADSPEAFAGAVVRLIRDTALATRLSRAARDLVEAQYDWRTALAPLDGIYGRGEYERLAVA